MYGSGPFGHRDSWIQDAIRDVGMVWVARSLSHGGFLTGGKRPVEGLTAYRARRRWRAWGVVRFPTRMYHAGETRLNRSIGVAWDVFAFYRPGITDSGHVSFGHSAE